MSVRSARRPLPALVFLVALAVLAVVVWVRVAGRDSGASASSGPTCASTAAAALPANASVTVTVINAKGTTGLAQTTLDAFKALGFVAGNKDNYTGTDPVTGVGIVTAGPNGAAAAKLVSYYVTGATVTTDNRQDTSVTVTLGPDFSAVATADVANAAIKAAGRTQATAAPSTPSASGAATGTPTGSASPAPSC